ncbi:AraC family transcriptional regulator [Sinomicrobium soli]|uniref:AraC family transcriptional regulator n=1 Tax=Sinomicrobium sp. N-1-3-6 TaxID=2219864 RepID=UPI001375215F|nr:helix-turn-helix domain-containing protein [Sinomicrobium sp. N-1-3-6]
MLISFTLPDPALRPYVKGYFYIELEAKPNAAPLDIHPVGYNTIAFTLNPKVFSSNDNDYDFSLSYHGYICKHISLLPLTPLIKMIVVSFTATGAAQLFRIPQHELLNQIVPFTDVFSASKTLNAQLEETDPCQKQALVHIEKWLLQQIPAKAPFLYSPNIDEACKIIQSCEGHIRIDELCQKVGMSQRYLESHFKEMIGVSPKLYCRISRFIAVYQSILQNSHVEWGELVYRYRFFDQAHFIRDFKAFFGYSPSKIHLANSHLTRKIIL